MLFPGWNKLARAMGPTGFSFSPLRVSQADMAEEGNVGFLPFPSKIPAVKASTGSSAPANAGSPGFKFPVPTGNQSQ